MDYHFIRPKRAPRVAKDSFPNVSKIIVRFLPLFVLAALLPVLIGFVFSPPNLRFTTSADTKSELRVWLEPANIIMSPGSEATFDVVAHYNNDKGLISEISLQIETNGEAEVVEGEVNYKTPFTGRIDIGKVKVRAMDSGSSVIRIPVESIFVSALGELDVSTSTANIIVR